jgi:hypothetical protein
MNQQAAKLRADNNLAALPEKDRRVVGMIINTSVADARNTIQLMREPDAANQRILETALDLEKASPVPRVSILDLIRAGLRRVTVREAPVEVLAPETPALPAAASIIPLINANHARAQQDAAQARALGESAVRHAILAGLQLVQLKDATPHGQWEALFASGQKRLKNSNVAHVQHLKMDHSTARRYIAVATQLVSRKLQPEQSAALMALAAGAPADDSAAALLDEITPPKSLRQTYLELGIVKPTPKEAAWLSAEPASNPADPAAPQPTPAARLRSLSESARRDWFGDAEPGCCAPGSPVALMETELNHPARGTLRLLSKEDLEAIADLFRRCGRAAADHAKDK